MIEPIFSQVTAGARLIAVVALDPMHKVLCQQQGCGRGIYARVHVVLETGHFKVLGSDCYANHYGGSLALGPAAYGWGGTGVRLTDEQRALLLQNTQALIAQFEEREVREREARERQLREQQEHEQHLFKVRQEQLLSVQPAWNKQQIGQHRPSPWAWQKERTSVAEFQSPQGQCWFRVQHKDGSQKLVPWPKFKGWEDALPLGFADQGLGAVSVPDIVKAIAQLKACGYVAMSVGSLDDVLRERMGRR